MQHPVTDTAFPGPWQGREKQNASVHVPLMIGTMVSHSSGILAFEGNLVSSVQVDGTGNTLSSLTG